jgi:CheY-like chemotaxis protein
MKGTVLVLDDDRLAMVPYVRALRKAGLNVTQRGDADAALCALAGEEYDIIVLDIMLPPGRRLTLEETDHGIKTGVLLLERLRGINRDVPVLVLTNVINKGVLDAIRQLEGPRTRVLRKSDCLPLDLVDAAKDMLRYTAGTPRG